MDLAARRLSRREAFFKALEVPECWEGSLDRQGLLDALARRGPAPTEPRALWLYVAAVASESEAYGVELELDRRARAGLARSPEDQLYLIFEERYHLRILREICRTCGVTLPQPDPPRSMRLLIHLFEYLPDPVRYVGVLSGEVLGCVIFEMLADNLKLFAGQPQVESRLRSLVSEILRDERWHVLLCRTQIGPIRARLARWLAPWVVRVLLREIPDLSGFGYDRKTLLERMYSGLSVPTELDWPEPAPLIP